MGSSEGMTGVSGSPRIYSGTLCSRSVQKCPCVQKLGIRFFRIFRSVSLGAFLSSGRMVQLEVAKDAYILRADPPFRKNSPSRVLKHQTQHI